MFVPARITSQSPRNLDLAFCLSAWVLSGLALVVALGFEAAGSGLGLGQWFWVPMLVLFALTCAYPTTLDWRWETCLLAALLAVVAIAAAFLGATLWQPCITCAALVILVGRVIPDP